MLPVMIAIESPPSVVIESARQHIYGVFMASVRLETQLYRQFRYSRRVETSERPEYEANDRHRLIHRHERRH